MPYCIGTDEAGYGPNLGPLVITATLWRVPDGIDDELYEPLKHAVCAVSRKGKAILDDRLWLADSKAVYASTGGIEALEFGVLAALAACGLRPADLRGLLREVCGVDHEAAWRLPWHGEVDVPVPLACLRERVEPAAERFAAGLRSAGVELVAMRSRVVFPEEFNAEVDRHGNKSTLLTQETLRLVRAMLDRCDEGRVSIACDKHGGRNSYAPALQEHVVEGLVQVLRESRTESSYRWTEAARSVEISFRPRSETRLPAALASMTSKYVREATMRAWNEFWKRHLPEIRPTAGYPLDAARFRRDIGATARKLKLDKSLWWRSR
ncbi:MAG: hypothetical protein K8U03_21390 [Planctomycetia bacterium]|nr:hypothetical protein [Planctomycetia bacterium]